ncbi:MAG TPA: TetR/AcrR family transcriptional regulator [Polyangia bacterium]|nr:TetR/AcrR family transcriptional regulator [Polyangia bacterium]
MMVIMRYPAGHKEEVRARIVNAAARALCRDGLLGASIPALMKDAGLTHGGFYAHFDDRDELVAEAVEAAAARTGAEVFAEGAPLEDALARYLSSEHLGAPDRGCVVAALGTEGAHASPSVRQAFAKAARGLLALVDGKLRPGKRAKEPSDEALRLTAAMVGAVVLGRLVDDPVLAERMLKAARRSLPR